MKTKEPRTEEPRHQRKIQNKPNTKKRIQKIENLNGA